MLNSSFSQKLRYNDNFPGSRFSTHKKTPLVQTATVHRELKEGKKNQTKKILRPTEKDYGSSFGLKYTKADDAPEREKTTRQISPSEQARQRAEQQRRRRRRRHQRQPKRQRREKYGLYGIYDTEIHTEKYSTSNKVCIILGKLRIRHRFLLTKHPGHLPTVPRHHILIYHLKTWV